MPLYEVPAPPPRGGLFADRPQLPYLLPFLGFVAVMAPGLAFDHWLGIDWEKLWFAWHPWLYLVKTVVAAALLWFCWKHYTTIRWSQLPLGVVVGLVGVPLWVLTEYASQHVGYSHAPDPQKLYDPVAQIPNPTWRYLFYFIRVAGPTLVVPVMEELFFRDFLMRVLVRGVRFLEVDVGAFAASKPLYWLSLLGMSLAFAINHVQQPSGFLYGLLMGVLLIRTKSLGACIVAHGVTNLVLYSCYTIPFGKWEFM